MLYEVSKTRDTWVSTHNGVDGYDHLCTIPGSKEHSYINQHGITCHFATLEIPDLLAFAEQYGDIVLQRSDEPGLVWHVEIYNYYRE